MSSAPRITRKPPDSSLPPLVHGERMEQPEFHRRYEAYPEDVKIELIGGTVYVASPLRLTHSDCDGKVGFLFETYCLATTGVQALHGATNILGKRSEPQPDLGLRVRPEFGGQSRDSTDDYLVGAAELLAEISVSTRKLDLHAKRDDYKKGGVVEYLVVCVEEQELCWFHFPSGRPIKPDRRGIYRSRVFPGLWIDGPALLTLDSARLIKVLKRGLASPAHARFVKRLQAAHRKQSRQ